MEVQHTIITGKLLTECSTANRSVCSTTWVVYSNTVLFYLILKSVYRFDCYHTSSTSVFSCIIIRGGRGKMKVVGLKVVCASAWRKLFYLPRPVFAHSRSIYTDYGICLSVKKRSWSGNYLIHIVGALYCLTVHHQCADLWICTSCWQPLIIFRGVGRKL